VRENFAEKQDRWAAKKPDDDIEDAFDELVLEEMAAIEADRPKPEPIEESKAIDTFDELAAEARPVQEKQTDEGLDSEVKTMEEVP